jgi:Putative MetA-pathway of phenol degradation
MKKFIYLLAACSVIVPSHVSAKEPKQNEVSSLKSELKKQREIINTQQQKIDKLEAMMDSFLDDVRGMGLPENTARVKPVKNKVVAEKSAIETKETPAQVGLERKPAERETPPEIAALADEGGVLSKAGKLVIEPQFEYSRSSSLAVAIEGFTIIPALNIGSFQITQVDRDTLTTAISAKYGITNKLEIETRVPFIYRSDSVLTRPVGAGVSSDVLSDASGFGIGDIEVAGHYQLMEAHNWWPFIVGNLRLKSATGESPFDITTNSTTGLQETLPTGSGYYAVQPSFTFIKPSDPVVFYGNLGYTYNAVTQAGGAIGEIDPGDAVNMGMGMGFSVNEKASFSLGYSHDMVLPTTQNGNTLPTSDTLQIGSLNVGYAYRMTDNTNLNFNIGAGLTDDAPDVRLTTRIPMSFELFE